MLLELRVTNFAIIDNVHLHFQKGLNILSGETGAGKSILLKSLGLLIGQKASVESVKSGCKSASIEGMFDLSHRSDILNMLTEFGIDSDEDTLVVRRVISSTGKSKVYLNGSLVSLHQLRDVVHPLIEVTGQNAPLIEMTGQHDNKNLQSKSYHLELLDQYTGSLELRQKYYDHFKLRQSLIDELDGLKAQSKVQEQKLDFLKFQQKEIEILNLQPGDEETLEKSVKRLKNQKKLTELAQLANEYLYASEGSALSRIHQVSKLADELKTLDPVAQKKLSPLSQAHAIIEDCLYEFENYVNQEDCDPQALSDLEEKLSGLRKLQKKYGPTIEDIFNEYQKIKSEVDLIENFDMHLKALNDKISKTDKLLSKLAGELHERRVNGAHLLTKGVNAELLDLNMKGLTFEVVVEQSEEFSSTGHSTVNFMTQTSKGEKLRPIAKFASGGELSRILLSLKRVAGTTTYPRTFLFDEVDTGVSGETAQKVGKKLKSIARTGQVICVTHLPQVASFADIHFLIHKENKKGRVDMKVVELTDERKVNEIARLISGETITKTSMDHAQELLAQAFI